MTEHGEDCGCTPWNGGVQEDDEPDCPAERDAWSAARHEAWQTRSAW